MNGFMSDLLANLIVSILVFILGFIISRLPRHIKKRKFRNFFGKPMLNDTAKVIYGAISRSPSSIISVEDQPFLKKYHDGKEIKLQASDQLITHETVRSTSYIVQELARYTGKTVPIITDEEAYKDWNSTFMCIAGPAVNEMTHWALNEESNRFIRYAVPIDPKEGEWKFEIVSATEELSYTHAPGTSIDYGMIMKIRNNRFPEHFFFVCAGIGSWGTSGASWYLANNWQALYKEFKSEQFGIVVKVNRGSDTSATRVYP